MVKGLDRVRKLLRGTPRFKGLVFTTSYKSDQQTRARRRMLRYKEARLSTRSWQVEKQIGDFPRE